MFTYWFAILVVLFTNHPALSMVTTSAVTAQGDNPVKTASLGTGYRTETERFTGSCVSGTSSPGGKPESSFSFQQSLTEAEASSELGYGAGGRARFGVVEVSASAKFLQNATSNAYSISSVWISDYYMPVQRFVYGGKSPVGQSVENSDERWAITCGDEYIQEIDRGAKLFFTIRIDFTSEERKQQFETQFSVSGPLASAEGTLKQATREFSRDAKVTVAGFQIGGDVSKLTEVFGNSDAARQGFVQCSLGDFGSCATVIENALKYAADTNTGFPSQLANGAAELTYRRQSYTALGIFPKAYPFLKEVVAESRQRLHAQFEEHYKLMLTASRLLALPMANEKKAPIQVESAKIDANIATILAASKVCYDTPDDCPGKVNTLKLTAVQTSVLTLPPLVSAEMRIHTSLRGLLSREDSLRLAAGSYSIETPGKNPLDGTAYPPASAPECIFGPAAVGIDPGHPLNCPKGPNLIYCYPTPLFGRTAKLASIEPSGSVSAVLMIRGVTSVSVTPYFEGLALGNPINVHADARRNAGKTTDDYAFVVLRTTRQNPGWLDIDLAALRESLWADKIPTGDGVFGVVIEDAFGRQIKIDLEYDNWTTYPGWCSFPPKKRIHYTLRNRWWLPSGLSLSNPGPISEYGWAEIVADIIKSQ